MDGDTVIAATLDSGEDGRHPGHRLLDGHTLESRGTVDHPRGRAVDSSVRPLGDGTWLAYDAGRETLDRWALQAP
ncbi:hypothetical protein [Streptomyces sp. NPDC046759]|uniref:hypothetical protein n=1 Tax=Streptomyces sp. NPDC046759 TaxID=3155019 RepID=UPI0033D0CDC6